MSSIHIILIVIIVILALLNLRLKLRQPSDKRHFMMPERLGLHVSNNDIMHFLKDCTDDIKSFMDHRGIDFKMRCEPESMMGWLDTELLDRILILLLSDMAKHLDHGGKITIAAYTNQRYDNITLRISDNGSKFSDTGLLLIHYMVASIAVQSEMNTSKNKVIPFLLNCPSRKMPMKPNSWKAAARRPSIFPAILSCTYRP